MNRVASVAMSFGMLIGGDGIQPIENHLPNPSVEIEQTDQVLIFSETETLDYEEIRSNRFLEGLATDTAIQIVYIPTVSRDESKVEEPNQEDIDKLLDGDLEFKESLIDDIASATHGRFRPSDIIVTAMPPVDTGDSCLDREAPLPKTFARVIAEYYSVSDLITVVFVDQPACNDKTLGFSNYGALPIINADAPKRMAFVILHEIGHSIGADHEYVDVGTCPSIIRLLCEETIDDKNSIMAPHARDDATFNAANLFEFGLLRDGELLPNPEAGVYTINAFDGTDPNNLKVLTFEDDERGETVFISFEYDAFSDNTVQTVQVRRRSDEKAVSSGEQTAEDGSDDIISGTIKPGSTLFSDETIEVSLIGIDSSGSARIGVQSTTPECLAPTN